MRINKFLSKAGYCSRRKADDLVNNGRVQVNGAVATIGMDVTGEDIVMVNGEIVMIEDNNEYIVFNKPRGITVTTATHDDTNIIDYISYHKRIFPIGRLDKDSEGLILLTNDGEIVNKILKSRYDHEKEYIVTVNKKLTKAVMEKLARPVKLEVGTTKPSKVQKIDEYTFRIIITQGLNRQIRRMCEVFGYRVRKLKRIRIINIKLNNLPVGQWKKIEKKKLQALFDAIEYKKDLSEY